MVVDASGPHWEKGSRVLWGCGVWGLRQLQGNNTL